MNAERLLQHYEQIADAPDAIARLRRFILDLAVRGKLVPQDPKDDAVPEVSLEIVEKQRGQLNAEISAPFKLPSGWRWRAVKTIAEQVTDGEHATPPRITETQVPLVTAKNVRDGSMDFARTDWVSLETAEKAWKRCKPVIGDLLLVCVGATTGRLAVLREPVDMVLVRSVALIRPSSEVSSNYLEKAFGSSTVQEQIWASVKVTAQPCLYINRIQSLSIPLPPLAEQHRIVAKVDELMALCNELEAAQTERETKRDRLAAASLARLNTPDPETFRDDARFALDALPALTARPDQIKQLRQTVLNLAVRGKLVPQDPADEPAAELLKRISIERDELVRKGTIRRDAPLESATPQDCPHSIPNSWVWSRVGDAVLFTQYGTSQKSHASQTGVPVLTMGNIQDGCVIWGNEKRIPESSDDLPALYLKTSDLLYNRTNSAELVGKTGIYKGQNDVRTFASYLIRLRPSLLHSSPVYLNVAMNAPCFRETQIVPLIKKQTGQANVSGSALKNMLIPLPPLAEQHRIVAKVDELMALCDQLETTLFSADETRKKLLDALLAEALAPVDAEALQEAAE